MENISGVAHNGLEQIDVEGQNVLIIGAGPIGLLATSVAKAMGEKQTDKQTDKERKKVLQVLSSILTYFPTNLTYVFTIKLIFFENFLNFAKENVTGHFSDRVTSPGIQDFFFVG